MEISNQSQMNNVELKLVLVPPRSFDCLTELILSHNNIEMFPFTFALSMKKLTTFDVSFNKIKSMTSEYNTYILVIWLIKCHVF